MGRLPEEATSYGLRAWPMDVQGYGSAGLALRAGRALHPF